MGWNQSIRNARAAISLAAIDESLNPAMLEFCRSDGTVIVVLQFAKPSFSRSDDLLTMLGAPRTSSRFVSPDGHGATVTNAQIRNGNGLLIRSGLTLGIAGSGADIILAQTWVPDGVNIRIDSMTLRQPACDFVGSRDLWRTVLAAIFLCRTVLAGYFACIFASLRGLPRHRPGNAQVACRCNCNRDMSLDESSLRSIARNREVVSHCNYWGY